MNIDDWNPSVRLAGYLAVLLVVLLAAFAIGQAVGPIADDEPAHHDTHVTHEKGAKQS